MKIKTIVTGCNRKQARSIALEQEARANKLELKILATQKLAANYKLRHKMADSLLNNTEEQLIEKSNSLAEAQNKNIELAKEISELNKNIVSLKDQLNLKEMYIEEKDKEIEHVNMRNGNLRQALKEVDHELALAKRPFYKKIFGIK